MAFSMVHMGKVSSSGNTQALNVWTYNGGALGANDTLAEISTAGYFNEFMQNLVTGAGPLQLGDIIFVTGSDDNGIMSVTDVTGDVAIAAFLPAA